MHTGLGKLFEHVLEGEIRDEYSGDPEVADQAKQVIIAMLSDLPHYVISEKLVAMVVDDYLHNKLMKSVKAMVHAGVAHLPFDPVLIEFRFEDKTAYVRLQSTLWRPIFDVSGQLRDDLGNDFYAYVVLTKPDPRPSHAGGLLMACVDGDKTCIPVDLVDEEGFPQPFAVYAGTDLGRGVDEDIAVACVLGMALAMLMLNTRGVIAEKVDTAKLNRARAKSSKPKPPINEYHVVRVGHIYDAAGKAHDVAGSGRHMPVHWRAGHVRNMRYGPAGPRGAHIPKEERPQRPVYIEPCLVNFDPGAGPAPLPKKEVVL